MCFWIADMVFGDTEIVLELERVHGRHKNTHGERVLYSNIKYLENKQTNKTYQLCQS